MSAAAGPALEAVLWDMDGTIVDTEPFWMEAEQALVGAHGGTWTAEQARSLVGNPLPVSAAFLQRDGGIDLPAGEIIDILQAHVVNRVAEQLPWRPGARELLAELVEARVRCALVTMSWTPLAHAVLAHVPPDTFDVVVTGDQVDDGKPHPAPYLRAIELLGTSPGRCVAIEDSTTGLASAEAAGVATIAIPHLVPIPDAAGRTKVASLRDVDLSLLLRVAAGPRPRGRRIRNVTTP
ncbi:MAG TPA: HAD family phosphatase [Actinomycetales bacterium]|nr:HAD family phosphatase [Actinomycetales bacterium]